MILAGGSKGFDTNANTAAFDAVAAEGPCPSPSATSKLTAAPPSAIRQLSPHSISPATARDMAPISRVDFVVCAVRDSAGVRLLRESRTVPCPGAENTSKVID